jgi:pimeloyl-ACP methyl ester carboxylesterase
MTGSLSFNGLTFNTLSFGPEDGELVLFLHGFPQFADAWLPILQPLAAAGYRAVAFDQRGYSPAARPDDAGAYTIQNLTSDVLAIATALGHQRFHLVGHDWGAVLAWQIAAEHPERMLTLTALSVPHTQAFLHAVKTNLDQMNRSKYILFFKLPGHLAEMFFLANRAAQLRRVYQGKLTPEALAANVRRLSEPGALTAALNWYRAFGFTQSTPAVTVPTLYLWSDHDVALGEAGALATAKYVTGPYRFERLHDLTHWLIEEAPERVTSLLLEHLVSPSRPERTEGTRYTQP